MNQEKIEELLLGMSTQIAEIHTSINGNGTKGLKQRMDDAENNLNWVNKYLISVSAVGVVFWSIAQFVNNWFQGVGVNFIGKH